MHLAKASGLLLLCLLLCTGGGAQNVADPPHLTTILEQLGLDSGRVYREHLTYVSDPGNSEQMLYVIPVLAEDEEPTPDYFALDGHFVTADRRTGQVRQHLHLDVHALGWTSDAIRLSAITIDRGRYYLREGQRAWGVRTDWYGSSRPNPYARTSLLLLPEGKTLVPVLRDYEVGTYRGDWDTQCAGNFLETTATLHLLPTQHSGLFDIEVRRTLTERSQAEGKAGDCVEIEMERTVRDTLRAVDGRYW